MLFLSSLGFQVYKITLESASDFLISYLVCLFFLMFSISSSYLVNLCSITWTKSMWRLYFLVERCYELREPVLLVGETGGGKTTVCQLLSIVLRARLHTLNCHQYTETSDFIGVGLYFIHSFAFSRFSFYSFKFHFC